LAICVPKLIKFGGNLTKFWQKQVGTFLDHPVQGGQKTGTIFARLYNFTKY